MLVLGGAHLDDVHVWRGGGRGGRGGGAEGCDSERGADLSSSQAVEVVVHGLCQELVSALVTGALVHSSPGDEKEWSVGLTVPTGGRTGGGSAQVAGLDWAISLPDQSGLVGAVSPRPHALNVTKLENVYKR